MDPKSSRISKSMIPVIEPLMELSCPDQGAPEVPNQGFSLMESIRKLNWWAQDAVEQIIVI